ncbi:hypothetical protein [Idiomarina sp. HP20-50]|uniref:hypothetical protein n=1 Tax=Idiomarina sp. HP20-50 TaxID=3070813 RepID=UPI00294B1A6C|nr:hypothetical protein [Idiomarina sp. HP20-50]MDV6316262.1 hypothetical protein [Idiomarina sp. HP20-50]
MAGSTPKKKAKRKGGGRPKANNYTWAWAIESILGKAMARGQLIPLAISVILIIAVIRMPQDELVTFVGEVLGSFRSGSYIGWGLFVIALLCWRRHVKVIRKESSQEMDRIGKEKNRAQEKLLGQHTK